MVLELTFLSAIDLCGELPVPAFHPGPALLFITTDLFYKRVPGYLENASLVLYIYKCSIARMVGLTHNSHDASQTKESWLLDYPVLRPFIL